MGYQVWPHWTILYTRCTHAKVLVGTKSMTVLICQATIYLFLSFFTAVSFDSNLNLSILTYYEFGGKTLCNAINFFTFWLAFALCRSIFSCFLILNTLNFDTYINNIGCIFAFFLSLKNKLISCFFLTLGCLRGKNGKIH